VIVKEKKGMPGKEKGGLTVGTRENLEGSEPHNVRIDSRQLEYVLCCHVPIDLLCASVARFLSGLGLYTFELVPASRHQTRIL